MSIQKLLNDALLKEQENRKTRKRSGRFSPSMFGRCYRAQILNRSGETPSNPPDVRLLRVFKVGQLMHDMIQKYIPDHQKEVRVESDLVVGYADIVTDDCVYDIKSVNSKSFWYSKKKEFNIKKDKYCNILQVMTYCYLLNKPTGWLCFVSKDDLCMEEYSFKLKDWRQEVELEMSNLELYASWKELPPAEPRTYNGKECTFCNFKDLCEGLKDGHK